MALPEMKSLCRRIRLRLKAWFGRDVWLPVTRKLDSEHHGSDTCGWPVLCNSLSQDSIVYSFGIGEDASFDVSLIGRYGCRIYAFDPTPKSVEYVRCNISEERFMMHQLALADHNGTLDLFLPTNESHVSASLQATGRTQGGRFTAECRTLREIMQGNGHRQINVLKVDIEGAEYTAIGSSDGLLALARVHQLLIEFHHWMPPFSVADTRALSDTLFKMGFEVVWTSPLGHEVFFVNRNWESGRECGAEIQQTRRLFTPELRPAKDGGSSVALHS
jgi:FkbM family methyltransferase